MDGGLAAEANLDAAGRCALASVLVCQHGLSEIPWNSQKFTKETATEDFDASERPVRSEASAPFAPPSPARGLLVCPKHWPAIANGFGRVKGLRPLGNLGRRSTSVHRRDTRDTS